jgi:hypothetical protein
LAFDLLPISFDTVPIHDELLHEFFWGDTGDTAIGCIATYEQPLRDLKVPPSRE